MNFSIILIPLSIHLRMKWNGILLMLVSQMCAGFCIQPRGSSLRVKEHETNEAEDVGTGLMCIQTHKYYVYLIHVLQPNEFIFTSKLKWGETHAK